MGLLEQQYANGLLNQPVTANRNMLAQALKARQTTPRNALTGQGLLDTAAIGLSPIPVIGDLLGLGADASRFYNEPESRTPLNFGLAALGLIPFVPPLVSAGLGKFAQSQGKSLAQAPTGPARNQAGAIVYHGSPHKFDQFDSSKIGTGEGAQAYGHGLYFAENPSVAESYQKTLAGKEPRVLKGVEPTNEYEKYAVGRVNDKLRIGNKTVEQAIKETILEARNLRGANDPSYVAREGKIASYLENLWDAKPEAPKNTGALYKVDLPDEAIAKMLDWDKPLSQQNLQGLGSTVGVKDQNATGVNLFEEAKKYLAHNPSANAKYKNLNSNVAASEFLKDNGFLGIKYLDGGSRGGGQGTSNYVVFPGNEGLLKILERQ
jgi:hypothetical protein